MKILGNKLNLKQFQDYVDKKDFGSMPPTSIVLHHTYNPEEDDGDGIPEKGEWNIKDPLITLNGIKKNYEGKGWSAGPHIFIYDEEVFLFTDMYDVGIHAGDGNGSLKTGYSIGIEVVGNYDIRKWDAATERGVAGVLKPLMEKLNIKESDIKFHSDYSTKTCPGRMITKEYVLNLLKEEVMIKDFVSTIEKITGEKYGDNINESEQKDAAKRMGQKIDTYTGEIAVLKNSMKEDTKKILEQADNIKRLEIKLVEKSAEIEELKKIKDSGVAALGVIRLLQEAFKQLINFK